MVFGNAVFPSPLVPGCNGRHCRGCKFSFWERGGRSFCGASGWAFVQSLVSSTTQAESSCIHMLVSIRLCAFVSMFVAFQHILVKKTTFLLSLPSPLQGGAVSESSCELVKGKENIPLVAWSRGGFRVCVTSTEA